MFQLSSPATRRLVAMKSQPSVLAHQLLETLFKPLKYFSTFDSPVRVMELWIVAVAWILWRLWSVLTTRTEVLEAILGRKRGLSPDFGVDQLGCDWAAVRWRYPQHVRHAAKHLLELRDAAGDQVLLAETERGRRRHILEDLQPDCEYEVSLYALPSRRLLAQIWLHTTSHPGDRAPTSEWAELGELSELRSELRNDREIKYQPRSLVQLKQEIETLQAEFVREHEARLANMTEFSEQRADLEAQLEQVSASRRSETASRAHQRAETKALEDLKHSLDAKRRAELRRNQELKQALESQKATQTQWEAELESNRRELEAKRRELETHISLSDNDNRDTHSLHNQVEQLDKQVKREIRALKDGEKSRDRVRALLGQLEKHTDLSSGFLKDSFKVPENLSEQEIELVNQFRSDSAMEHQWERDHQALEQQYIAAYQKNEQASKALRSAQARAAAQSQEQAQIYASAFTPGLPTATTAVPAPLPPSVVAAVGPKVVPPPPTAPIAAPAPAPTSLLPSNLFRDDPPVTHLPPSPALGYPVWNTISHRSRDSSIFFSAAGSTRSDSRDVSPVSSHQGMHQGNQLSQLAQQLASQMGAPMGPVGSPVSASVGASVGAPMGPPAAPHSPLSRSPDPNSGEFDTPKPTTTPGSSPEKSRWGRLGKKPTTAPSATNFVRRLSFFRKESRQEDEL